MNNARTHDTGYTSSGFQSSVQATGSLARAVTVDNESATKPARCIPSTLTLSKEELSAKVNFIIFVI